MVENIDDDISGTITSNEFYTAFIGNLNLDFTITVQNIMDHINTDYQNMNKSTSMSSLFKNKSTTKFK